MTLRDFSVVNRKETADVASEHNFSMVSQRDIDDINDVSIIFTDDRKSDVRKDSNISLRLSDIKLNNDKEREKERKKSISMDISPYFQRQKLNTEMDSYLTKTNEINGIKI
jgi:hypothetical protein